MENLISIGLGGAIGAVLRYCTGNMITKLWGSSFPYGTFCINLCGCLLMGFLMTLIVDKGLLPPIWRLFLCVGVLGGFTTFSSFGYESLTLLQEGNILFFLLYTLGSTGLGVIAALLGVKLAAVVCP